MCFDGFNIIVPGIGKGVGVLCVGGVQIIVFSSISLFLLIDTSLSYFSHSFKIKIFEVWRKWSGQIMKIWKERVMSWDSGCLIFEWMREENKEKGEYNNLIY